MKVSILFLLSITFFLSQVTMAPPGGLEPIDHEPNASLDGEWEGRWERPDGKYKTRMKREMGLDGQSAKPSGLPHILPLDLEIELALSAAPKHLREGAMVYVLGEEGYKRARVGGNGFTCFVVRGPCGHSDWDNMVAPYCYDEEGMQSIGAVSFDRAKYRRQGLDGEEIRTKINEGFASGKYFAPRKPGVIYMLSPVNKVPDHRTGKLFDYVPHVMYYAPFIKNDDIGVPASQHLHNPEYVWNGLPFVPSTGPHGFIVQPLGEKERAHIIEEYQDLMRRMRKYIPLDIRDE